MQVFNIIKTYSENDAADKREENNFKQGNSNNKNSTGSWRRRL